MQGRKIYEAKLFYQIGLEQLVPEDNFYRKINDTLDFNFLYQQTAAYYGEEGQESIDPVVFFKILLVGYLNNINSDRSLIRYCSNCLDIRLFLGYFEPFSLAQLVRFHWHNSNRNIHKFKRNGTSK